MPLNGLLKGKVKIFVSPEHFLLDLFRSKKGTKAQYFIGGSDDSNNNKTSIIRQNLHQEFLRFNEGNSFTDSLTNRRHFYLEA